MTTRKTQICALVIGVAAFVLIAVHDVQATDIEVCFNPALLKTDPMQVAAACQKAAAQGDARAQDKLGNLYVRGQGVPRDYAQAAVWFRRSAKQNNTAGQFDLGTLYDYGHGVPQDYELAYIWYNLAEIGGNNTLHLAAAFRDSAAQHLTSAQIADAKKRSSAWKPGTEP